MWTGSLLPYFTGGPGHWTTHWLLHRVQPIKQQQTVGNGLPGPINKVEAYTWKCVCLMHDAGATNKVQPESWKCVCLMHDACSFLFSDLAGWDSPLSHILRAKGFMDSIVQCELGPWSLIPLVDRVTGQLIHCCTEFKQCSSTKLLKIGYPIQSTK